MSDLKLQVEHLAKADYLQYDVNGKIAVIYCKCCGTAIAHDNGKHMVRYKTYTEIKIRFADKTHHVTHCCRMCIGLLQADQDLLMAAYQADVAAMMREVPKLEVLLHNKERPRIVQVDIHQRGIQ